MATMNISLPDKLKAFVDERVAAGGYSTTSDFVREVLRREQKRHEAYINFVRVAIKEGIESGVSEETPEQIFESVLAGRG